MGRKTRSSTLSGNLANGDLQRLEASMETKFQRLEGMYSAILKEGSPSTHPINRVPGSEAPAMAKSDVNGQSNSLHDLVGMMHEMQDSLKQVVPDITAQAHALKAAQKSNHETQCTVNTLCVCLMEFSKLIAKNKCSPLALTALRTDVKEASEQIKIPPIPHESSSPE